MSDFERQSRRAADQEILSDEVAEEISHIPTEVIDLTDAPPLAPPAPLDKSEVRTIIMSLMLTMFLAALEQTIVATALPTLGRQFGDVSNLSWVITAYLLAATAVAPVFGTLSDIYGRRVMVIISIGLFMAGSVLCAVAWSLPVLIVARGLQGLGGGGILGPVLGGLFAEHLHWSMIFWINLPLGIAALALLLPKMARSRSITATARSTGLAACC
jgi:MFS family permease